MPCARVEHLGDTAASLAISTGASIKVVQRILGYASEKITLDVYGSLFEEDLEPSPTDSRNATAISSSEPLG